MSLRPFLAIIDGAFEVAERVVRWVDDRKAKKRQLEAQQARGLSHQDVERQQVQIRTATSGGKLTILPPPRKPRIER